jgi:hypothetical protein
VRASASRHRYAPLDGLAFLTVPCTDRNSMMPSQATGFALAKPLCAAVSSSRSGAKQQPSHLPSFLHHDVAHRDLTAHASSRGRRRASVLTNHLIITATFYSASPVSSASLRPSYVSTSTSPWP